MRIKQFTRTFGWTKEGKINQCSVKGFVTRGVPLPKIAPSLLHPVRIFIIRYVWSDIHIHVNVVYAHLSYQHNPCVVSLVAVSIKTLDVSADQKYICIYIYTHCIAYHRWMVLVHI